MYKSLDVIEAIEKIKNPEKARQLMRFFKTGKGQYGEGDIFYGLIVPKQRELVQIYYKELPISEIPALITSPIHEIRLTGLLIAVKKFSKASLAEQKELYDLYLSHTKYINNWDLVDLSAPHIVGIYLLNKDRSILTQMAKSDLLWNRRIAVLATFAFIRHGEYSECIKLCEMLLTDKHDLIHKATGWMLREIYKRNPKVTIEFLDQYSKVMPRTMLRYAIEKLTKVDRQKYLNLK